MFIFDVARREQELAHLEAAAADPQLWDNPDKAQRTMQAVARAKNAIVPWQSMMRRAEDARTLIEMAQAESGQSGDEYAQEVRAELTAITAELETFTLGTLLIGQYDPASAIVELKPGAGGTDACDWAAMMLRMYLRWADQKGYKATIVSELPGEVAGISSATVFVEGENAYGFLRAEHGVHRLVRISPFNSSGKRQTSFAAVEVVPQIDAGDEVVINNDDIDIDVFRASGAGGQHVNKTSSAVRITHRPTGLVVTCQNERSQLQNKEFAMRMLQGKLAEIQAREEEEKMAKLRGEQRAIEWGSQIRSYVFQPYTLVKDHRTGVETSDVNKVMEGDALTPFLTGYLRWRAGEGGDAGNEDATNSDDL